MQIKNGKDFWAGLMFIGFGLFFFLVARNYNMGTALRMGPAYFPTVLGGMLIVLGAVTTGRSFFSHITVPWRLFEFNWKTFVASVVLGGFSYWQYKWLQSNEWLEFSFIGAALILFFASFGKRSLWQILTATLAFGYLLKPLGLILATFFLVLGAGQISSESRTKEVLILAVALAIFSWLVFVKGLDQPFPVWPSFITG